MKRSLQINQSDDTGACAAQSSRTTPADLNRRGNRSHRSVESDPSYIVNIGALEKQGPETRCDFSGFRPNCGLLI
jgi:hypothetical protein